MKTIYRVGFKHPEQDFESYAYFFSRDMARDFMKIIEKKENYSEPFFNICHVKEDIEEAKEWFNL